MNGIHENPLNISLYVKNCLSTSAVIVKKELLIKHGGFDERLMSSQDYDLWLKLSPYLVLYKINDILGEYHETSNSITAKFYFYRVFDQLLIAYRYKSYVTIHQYYFKVFKIIFSKQWFYGLKNIFFGNKSHNYARSMYIENIKILILVGGFGTRLKDVVSDVPKPMAPINNKPFLLHKIEKIREYLPKNQIYLLTHHMSDIIEEYFRDYPNIEFIKEEEALGTGGSIKNAIAKMNLPEQGKAS